MLTTFGIAWIFFIIYSLLLHFCKTIAPFGRRRIKKDRQEKCSPNSTVVNIMYYAVAFMTGSDGLFRSKECLSLKLLKNSFCNIEKNRRRNYNQSISFYQCLSSDTQEFHSWTEIVCTCFVSYIINITI